MNSSVQGKRVTGLSTAAIRIERPVRKVGVRMRHLAVLLIAFWVTLGCKTRIEKRHLVSSHATDSKRRPPVRIILLVPDQKLGLTTETSDNRGSEITSRELAAGAVGAAVVAAAVRWKLGSGTKAVGSSPHHSDGLRSPGLTRSVGKERPPKNAPIKPSPATLDSLSARSAGPSKMTLRPKTVEPPAEAEKSKSLSDPRVVISPQSSDKAINLPTSEVDHVVVAAPPEVTHAPVLSTPEGLVILGEFDEVDGVRLLKAEKGLGPKQIENLVDSSSAFRLSLADKERLGEGNFGEVFSWNGYAVKFDKNGENAKIISEARELVGFKHTGAVPDVLGLVADDAGRLGLVMEKGQPLDKYLGKSPIDDHQVVAALANFRILRKQGTSWSDIKPANMLVVGTPPRIKFIDIDSNTSPAYGVSPEKAFVKSMIEAKLGQLVFQPKLQVRTWFYARQTTPELRRKAIDLGDQFLEEFKKLKKSAQREYDPKLDNFFARYRELLKPSGDGKWPGYLGEFEGHPALKDNPQRADWDSYRSFLEEAIGEPFTGNLKQFAQEDIVYALRISAEGSWKHNKFFDPMLERAFPTGSKVRQDLDKLLAETR